MSGQIDGSYFTFSYSKVTQLFSCFSLLFLEPIGFCFLLFYPLQNLFSPIYLSLKAPDLQNLKKNTPCIDFKLLVWTTF